jgi:hypothetical protein
MPPQPNVKRSLIGLIWLIVIIGVGVAALPWLAALNSRLAAASAFLAVCTLHLAIAWPFRAQMPVVWQILISLTYGAIGLYLTGRPGWPLEAVRTPLIVYLAAYAAFEIVLFAVRRAPARGWLLASATVALIAAATIWLASLSTVAPMVGANIAAGGLARLFLIRRSANARSRA